MSKHFLYRILFFLYVWTVIAGECGLAGTGSIGEYRIVEIENRKGLADRSGDLLIPAVYEDLGWSNRMRDPVHDVIGYRVDGLWGLINLRNEKVLEPVYGHLFPYKDNAFIASRVAPGGKSSRYGTVNSKGKVLLGFAYTDLKPWGDHMIAAVETPARVLYGVIDDRGRTIVPCKFLEIAPLTTGIAGARGRDNLWTLLSAEGHPLCPVVLDSLRQINGQFTAIYAEGKAGWVAHRTGMVQPPDYGAVADVGTDGLHVKPLKQWYVIDGKNQVLDTFRADAVQPLAMNLYRVRVGEAEALMDQEKNNLTGFKKFSILSTDGEKAIFKHRGKYGVLSLEGSELLTARYDSIVFLEDFYLAREVLEGRAGWSVMNRSGKRITSDVYDEILPVETRFFRVRRDRYWGVVNSLGSEILPCVYDTIEGYQNGRFKVNLHGEDGILDINGDWVVMPQKKEIDLVGSLRYLIRSKYGSYVYYYPKTIDFRGEYYLYWKGNGFLERTDAGKLGWVNTRGRRIIAPLYDEITPLQEDSIYIARNGEKYSFISRSGEMLSRMDNRFEKIRPMSETFIGVRIDGAWGFVDVNGKLRVANRYEDIGPFTDNRAPIRIRGKWGFIDQREKLKVQPKYDRVYAFKNGLSIVVKDGMYGLIDKEGRIELATEYEDISPLKNGGYKIMRNGKLGLADQNGRSRFWPRFDEITDLGNGAVIVEYNGRYGIVALDGTNIVPPVYEALIYDPFRKLYLAAHVPEGFQAP